MELLQIFLVIGTLLFAAGVFITLTKRNTIMVLIGIELIFNAANLNFVAFSAYDPARLQGNLVALFVMILAAAEASIGLAIIIRVYQYFKSVSLDEIATLRG